MSRGDDDLRIRPGRIRDGRGAGGKAKSFVAQVMTAARKAGHTGYRLNGVRAGRGRSTFGRGRFAGTARRLSSSARRVVVKARVVRHRGQRFRAAPLNKHLAYLKREGVTRDGADARLFDREGEAADARAFAERCGEDRHHFRFIVSPEDAPAMSDLRGFTRDLMAQAEHDLGTRLDWVAIDHWNTDQPHVHVLIRGRDDDGADLVISRDYISKGLRGRAEELVTLELGQRSGQEIRTTLEAEVGAERWTGLDQALRSLADENAGVADLRPGLPEPADPELRRLLVGRAQTLERFGLSERIAPAMWTLRPGAEETLRELSIKGDIIKTMHRAMASHGERALGDFAVHDHPDAAIVGRLADRGLHDELAGTAYVVIDGVDGRVHHLRLPDLEATGDTPVGGIVEASLRDLGDGGRRLAIVGRSDLPIDRQVASSGATWLDRVQVARDPVPLAGGGFGAEVRAALEQRADHLVTEGLARRQGQRVIFARDLLGTLKARELDAAAGSIAQRTGLEPRPAKDGDQVAGVYRQRLDLASGRFAMLDDGLGFQLVPWRPALEQHLGRQVSGVVAPGGGIDWSFGRKRGLAL
ncbi:MAG: relaxase/mobilization nuclease domain-containing protein [Allosphingosinicella sp.]|uniref:relaxase/mobilization nuclease domain-containing protein n=1 Tax=Allosphingosinicella sp. TaxID=2823234 RepID=UPI003921F3F8